MVYFHDLYENGQSYLCIVEDHTFKAVNAKHKYLIHPSMLRNTNLDAVALRRRFPKEMTTRLGVEVQGGPAYALQSTLKEKEKESKDSRPFMLGRQIIHGAVRWGFNQLKILGEFTYTPLYWEWTEDVIGRCDGRLKTADIYDAVYASLYSYDREPNVMRAFCESWCSRTNTLHTEVGEWSLSLWDFNKLGGLPIAGRLYDEFVPSYKDMHARKPDGTRLIPRSIEHLFASYCLLADYNGPKKGVRASQWINF